MTLGRPAHQRPRLRTRKLEIFQAANTGDATKGTRTVGPKERVHCFMVHNIPWRSPPAKSGSRNNTRQRPRRLVWRDVFEAFFATLVAPSKTQLYVPLLTFTFDLG